jgi:hypothetical protein
MRNLASVCRLCELTQQNEAVDNTDAVCAPGEYGELLVRGGALLEGEQALSVGAAEVVGLLEAVLQRPALQPQCRNYLLTALMKLSTRFPDQADRIKVRTASVVLCQHIMGVSWVHLAGLPPVVYPTDYCRTGSVLRFACATSSSCFCF